MLALKKVFFSKKLPYLLKYHGLKLKCKKCLLQLTKKPHIIILKFSFVHKYYWFLMAINSNHCSHPTAQLYAIHIHSFVFVLAATNYFHTLKWQ